MIYAHAHTALPIWRKGGGKKCRNNPKVTPKAKQGQGFQRRTPANRAVRAPREQALKKYKPPRGRETGRRGEKGGGRFNS